MSCRKMNAGLPVRFLCVFIEVIFQLCVCVDYRVETRALAGYAAVMPRIHYGYIDKYILHEHP